MVRDERSRQASATTTERARAISAALDFLAQSQLPSGELRAYYSFDETLATDRRPDGTIFVTAIVLYCLEFVRDARARQVVARGLSFLRSEMIGPGLWQYWTRAGAWMPIPPDLDDTCCAAFVLQQHGQSFRHLRGLLLANRTRQGAFYTWLVPRWSLSTDLLYWRAMLPQLLRWRPWRRFWARTAARPEDVDCVVNANVLLLLGADPASLPAVEYLTGIIRERREACCDTWYRRPLSVYYAVSRAYFHGVRELGCVKDVVIERIETIERFPDQIEAALAACTLANFGCRSPVGDAAIQYLLGTQGPDGSWPALPLYWGGPPPAPAWGSEALTTGVCLEALARYPEA